MMELNTVTEPLRSPWRQRLLALPALVVAASLFGWALVYGVPLLRSDLQSQAARQQANDWARLRQGWTVEEWQAARADLLKALDIAPRDPVLLVTLAQLYVTQGVVAWDDVEQRQAYFAEALDHQRLVLSLRPTDGFTWAQVAVSLYALDRPAVEVHEAWWQAVTFAPREAPVQRALFDLALASWAQTTPDMQAWVLQTWRDAPPRERKAYMADARKWGLLELLPGALP